MFIRTSCLDGNLKILFLFFNSFTFAIFAFVFLFHYLSSALTIPASLRRLRVHSRTELNHFFNLAPALAFGALNDILTSLSITSLTIPSSKN